MDIYHTQEQTENTSRSCSYLLLKTLFYFVSQCTSVPYLESGLCKLGKDSATAILHLFSQETDLLRKVIMKCVNIKLWDILGCFHYILNPPRKNIGSCVDPNPLRVERQDPDNFPRLQTRESCALEIAAYVFKLPFFIKIFLSIFEWRLRHVFSVLQKRVTCSFSLLCIYGGFIKLR